MFKSTEIYIDLGTANTLIYVKGKGFVLNEPSYITRRKTAQNTYELVALGSEAKQMLGREHDRLEVLRPLKEGVIADFDMTTMMLQGFLERVKKIGRWNAPKFVISLPCQVTVSERQAVRELGRAIGARSLTLIEEPVAAALGSNLPIMESEGTMVIDVGGGTTEIAILSCGGIIHSNAVRVGGHHFDERIMNFIRQRYNFIIGEQTAEMLKIKLASALEPQVLKYEMVGGLDLTSGLPKRIQISSMDVYQAIQEPLREILYAVKDALSEAPPEVAGDLISRGLTLAGGGSLILGFKDYIAHQTGVATAHAESPLLSIAFGGAKAIESPAMLEAIAL